MKSSGKKLRVLFLLLQFVVFYIDADAFSINSAINAETIYSQNKSDRAFRVQTREFTNPDKKNATPNIDLTLTPSGAKVALLKWTTTDKTIPGTYYVERSDPSSGWIVLKQLPYDTILVYNDTISYPYCSSTYISYQIRFISSIDNITSTPKGAWLNDLNSPEDVRNLNVDLVYNITTGLVPRITWDQNTTDSVFRYHIQRYDNLSTSWPEVNSVPSDSSGFNDQTAIDPCGISYRYVVIAYDKCGNPSGDQLYDDIAVQTIVVHVADFEQCDKSAKLSWNSNHNMPGGISGFEIYRSDGGPAVVIDTVAPTVLSYVDNFNFINGTSYGYSIKAFSNNSSSSSSSCEYFQQYSGSIQPDTVYITQVSVVDDSYIGVGCYISPGSSVVQLKLERSDNNGTSFHAVDSLVVTSPLNRYYFNDSTVDVHTQSYSYRLIAIDDCGNKKASMNVSRSIYIECTPLTAQINLDWNTYQAWLQGVEGYDVYRILDGQAASIELLANAGQSAVSYADLHSSFDPAKSPCYWVVAKENPGNTILQNATSTSNTCCVLRDPVLYMPNAFYPAGKNKVFRPVRTPLFVDEQTFKMTIFNRWGQQLFETTDMVNGWDGLVNGQYTPAGMYTYLITYSSLEGKGYTKRGTVTLIR